MYHRERLISTTIVGRLRSTIRNWWNDSLPLAPYACGRRAADTTEPAPVAPGSGAC